MARSGVIYSGSGNFKTTAVKHFAHYIYEVSRKKTLLLSMDGGGWDPCLPEVLDGLISPYRCNIEIPLPVLRKISQGYWPKDPQETSGSRVNMIPVNWDEFGGVAVEGLTSFSNAIMRYLSDKGVVVGGEKFLPGKFDAPIMVNGVETRETFGSSTLGHYGFTQNVIYSTIMNLIGLPCLYVLFTALESKAEDEDRVTTYGPQVAGKKLTAQVPSLVGDCIHSEGYAVTRTTKVRNPTTGELEDSPTVETLVRSYFVKHPDPVTGILFPAKTRVTPERIDDLLKRYPGGFFVPGKEEGFDRYLHVVDELQRGQADSVRAWREKVDERHGRGAAASTVVAKSVEVKKG
jgi:hypothetical protein